MKGARYSWGLALLVAAGSLPSALEAQGFGVNEIGSCAVGRGFAVTARPCADPSTIFWNPAHLTRLEGLQFYAGAAPISIKGDWTEDFTGDYHEGDVPLVVPPHLFASYKVNPRLAAGIGMYVPYGLTSQWKTDFPGRFSAIKAELASIYVQPTIAFDVVPGRVSVGGGPIFGHSTVELYQALDLSRQQALPGVTFAQLGIPERTEFGRARLEGSANAWGWQIGGHGRLTNTLELGVRWMSALFFEYDDAEATFEQTSTGLTLPATLGPFPAGTPVDNIVAPQFQAGGSLTTRPGSSRIKHPGQVQAGLAFTGLARTTLEADYTFITWSDFDVLPVNFGGTNPPPGRTIYEDYEDVHRITLGVEHKLDQRFAGGRVNDWAIRAGIGAAKSPAPDETVTPLLPEMDRRNYSIGLGIPFGSRWSLDAAYLRIDTDGRRGRIVERESRDQTATDLNSGFYRLTDVNILSLSLKATF